MREIGTPTPGFYRARLVKGGPWVAARVWRGFGIDPVTREQIERAWRLRCEVASDEVDPDEWWPRLHGPIPADEWRSLRARARIEGTPESAPRRAVDLNNIRPLF